jgi:hypothetical protein
MLIVIKINPGTSSSRLDFEEVVSNKVSHQLESFKDLPAAQQVQRYPTSGAYNTSIINEKH